MPVLPDPGFYSFLVVRTNLDVPPLGKATLLSIFTVFGNRWTGCLVEYQVTALFIRDCIQNITMLVGMEPLMVSTFVFNELNQ